MEEDLRNLIKQWRDAGQYEPQWDIAADELEEIVNKHYPNPEAQ